MGFITENFLLRSETARYLYKKYACGRPILDYHCHLSPQVLAENRRFADLFDIWLEGDHYKWRAMRANGVPELYCTGSATPYEKFLAWARTVPHTLRNPLYHWTHLELLRYFDVDELLNEESAPRIWQRANDCLTNGDLTPQGIAAKFGVEVICTSDDPTDSLEYHQRLAASAFATHVFPTFRPDRALRTGDPPAFKKWVDNLASRAGAKINSFSDFLCALENRHDYFHRHGCRLSDHGLDTCPAENCTEEEAAAVFDKVRAGHEANPADSAKFSSYLMVFFAQLDAKKGWVKQLHLGAARNVNKRMLGTLGRDAGFDSIGDWPQMQGLSAYLDRLEQAGTLPKTIIYNANPAANYTFATMIGNFQDGTIAGKLQFGSGWWFLDQKEAIEWQLNALSNCGLLSAFVGMVTDSRSFMSFPRHEYFRRILCNLVGNEIEEKQLPDDEKLVGDMISRICYDNAARYLNLPYRQHGAARTRAAATASAVTPAVAGPDGHSSPARDT